jgi:Bacterial antitoxin of type II TA system, VapB
LVTYRCTSRIALIMYMKIPCKICLTRVPIGHTVEAMTKRTSINLDLGLVDEAKAVLETKETTETIHRALAEVVQNAHRQRLVHRTFDLSEDDLRQLREPRLGDVPAVSLRSNVAA